MLHKNFLVPRNKYSLKKAGLNKLDVTKCDTCAQTKTSVSFGGDCEQTATQNNTTTAQNQHTKPHKATEPTVYITYNTSN